MDKEGTNYCYSLIDKTSPNKLKTAGPNYGGGVSGVLMKDSNKWGKAWKDNKGDKVRILFIDLNKPQKAQMSRNNGSLGNLLSKKLVQKIFKIEKSQSEIKKMLLEDVLAIINEDN